MKPRLQPKKQQGVRTGAWLVYFFGRLLQVTGLVITLVAATAFFGTPSTIAMLRMMLVGVLVFIPGWLLARRDPRAGGES
jgi:hypothetical protein